VADHEQCKDVRERSPRRGVAVVFIILALAVLAAWRASFYWRIAAELVPYEGCRWYLDLLSGDCNISYLRFETDTPAPAELAILYYPMRIDPDVDYSSLFWVTTSDDDGRLDSLSMSVPLWAVSVILLLQPVLVGYRLAVRKHRARTGKCVGCGYDLRGNVSKRCPECGRTYTDKKTPASE